MEKWKMEKYCKLTVECCLVLPVKCDKSPRGHCPELKQPVTGQIPWNTLYPTNIKCSFCLMCHINKYVILNNSHARFLGLSFYQQCLCFDLIFCSHCSFYLLLWALDGHNNCKETHRTQLLAWCIFYFLNWRWKREIPYSIVFCLSESVSLQSNSSLLEDEIHHGHGCPWQVSVLEH